MAGSALITGASNGGAQQSAGADAVVAGDTARVVDAGGAQVDALGLADAQAVAALAAERPVDLQPPCAAGGGETEQGADGADGVAVEPAAAGGQDGDEQAIAAGSATAPTAAHWGGTR